MEFKIYADCAFVPDLGVVEYLSSGDVLRNDLNNCIKSFGSIGIALRLEDFSYNGIYDAVKTVVDKPVVSNPISDETVSFIKLLRKEARKWKFTQTMDLCESGDVYSEAGIFTDIVSEPIDGEDIKGRLFDAIVNDYIGQLSTQIHRAFKQVCEAYLSKICSQETVLCIDLKSVTNAMWWYQALRLTTVTI